MKRTILIIFILLLLLSGCQNVQTTDIAATTLPVYEFTLRICEGTDLTVTRLVTENVSCLHDYTLKVDQMRTIEDANLVILNGIGLEDFLEDALDVSHLTVDASTGLSLLEGHHHEHDHSNGHIHSEDPHIWLSPENAKIMAQNICNELTRHYPEHATQLKTNLHSLLNDLDTLLAYGRSQLSDLSYREIITFHDGFGYLAESFDLTILHAIEEESGAEASAAQLVALIQDVEQHNLPAIFIERNGSTSAANIIANETGAKIYTLDMAMSGNSYFDAMYHNIDTLREALQ